MNFIMNNIKKYLPHISVLLPATLMLFAVNTPGFTAKKTDIIFCAFPIAALLLILMTNFIIFRKINFNISNFPEVFGITLCISAGYFFMRWFNRDYGVISGGSLLFFFTILLVSFLLILTFQISFKHDFPIYIISIIIVFSYAYGAAYTVNIVLDTSNPTLTKPAILKKFKATGPKRNGYYFTIESWGKGDFEYSITPGEYDRHEIGDTICIKKYPGYLGVNWYSVNEFCN